MKALNLYDTKRPIKGHIQFARKDGTGFKYNHKIPYMSPLGLAGNFKMFWFILKEIILKKRDPLNKIRNSHPNGMTFVSWITGNQAPVQTGP